MQPSITVLGAPQAALEWENWLFAFALPPLFFLLGRINQSFQDDKIFRRPQRPTALNEI
jgi:hypothetical protein